MGRLNTEEEHKLTLSWARQLEEQSPKTLKKFTLSGLREGFYSDLKNYFALAALSRSIKAPDNLVEEALKLVFRTRVIIERSIRVTIEQNLKEHFNDSILFEGNFYGSSIKQGVSVRFSLTTCYPTELCSSGCYAHDVLDAAPASVIRGVINELIASKYQEANVQEKVQIMEFLKPFTRRAIKAAFDELNHIESSWVRPPYIRFAHVGEIAGFPDFANSLAMQVAELSNHVVIPVVYTRHPNAIKLDPLLWTINFTLDSKSRDRKNWIPQGARTVFSAFNGVLDNEAEINFLEHHRWSHVNPVGSGFVCPATSPSTVVRTCDAVRCALCFKKTKIALNKNM